jgi:hypothetical protein
LAAAAGDDPYRFAVAVVLRRRRLAVAAYGDGH